MDLMVRSQTAEENRRVPLGEQAPAAGEVRNCRASLVWEVCLSRRRRLADDA